MDVLEGGLVLTMLQIYLAGLERELRLKVNVTIPTEYLEYNTIEMCPTQRVADIRYNQSLELLDNFCHQINSLSQSR